MRTISYATAALACIFSTLPSQAGYGPLGHWSCSLDGKPAGLLVIEDSQYAYTPSGAAEPQRGALVINGPLVKVVSGPLAAMGASEGHYTVADVAPYVPSGDWASLLTFGPGPGNGLSCNPGHSDNSML